MNAQQESVAFWKFLESRGFHPTVRMIAYMLRELKVRFDDKALRGWLAPFRTAVAPHRHRTRTAVNEHDYRGGTAAAPHPHRGYARAANVSLVSKASDLTDPQPTASRQQKFNFTDPTEIEARRILDALWPLVAERVGSSMTKTAWRRRNKTTALDFARTGVPIERIVAGHAELSHQRGDVIFTLSWVQDYLAKAIPIREKSESGSQPAWLVTAMERGTADAQRRSADPQRSAIA